MTKDEIYQAAQEMSAEEQANFKAFLFALLESEDIALLPASDQQESV